MNLTPEQVARLDDATAFLQFKGSKAYVALKRILDEFEGIALKGMREYEGSDEKEAFNLLRVWHARCDLRELIEQRMESESGKFAEVAEELNISLDELTIRREIAHG